jgi:DNA replication and repair protein RecF
MYICHLELLNYRNYARLELDLSARIHLFQGDNAQGKTNLLEAIYYVATTRSPLASLDRELIRWESLQEDVIPNAQLALRYVRGGEEHTLEASLVQEPSEANGNGGVFRRQLRHNGVNRRAMDIVGKLNVVLFLPEDIVLVSGSPGDRRRYLDITLCQIDEQYCRSLSRYNRVVSQRNALLRQIREGGARLKELAYWDGQVARLGAYVMARRVWAIERLSRDTLPIQRALTGDLEELALRYEHTLDSQPFLDAICAALRDPALRWRSSAPDGEILDRLEEQILAALQRSQREEVARGVTVTGPHRDDMRFIINGFDATIYGSRGQQRTAALALKLAEVSLMQHQVGEMPVLLLDDVLSELDRRRGQYLLEAIGQAQQVLVTATSEEGFGPAFVAQAQVWRVQGGAVYPAHPG